MRPPLLRVGPGGTEIATLLAGELEAPVGARRRLIGLVGAPGVGKSTVAEALAGHLEVPVIAMDGFHLADVELRRRRLLDRKGAPETFDAWGLADLLARVASRPAHVVMAPNFERDLEQPLAGAVPVPPDVDNVIVEGNYLLLDEPAWRGVHTHLDSVWQLEVDDALRRERLVERHVRHGRSREEALAWVAHVDDPNAERVAAARDRADVVLDITDWDGCLEGLIPGPSVPTYAGDSAPPHPLEQPPVRETHRL